MFCRATRSSSRKAICLIPPRLSYMLDNRLAGLRAECDVPGWSAVGFDAWTAGAEWQDVQVTFVSEVRAARQAVGRSGRRPGCAAGGLVGDVMIGWIVLGVV